MLTDCDLRALKRYWCKKPKWLPRCAEADWSRVLARRSQVIGLWAPTKMMRVLPTRGVIGNDGWRWSWRSKRAFYLEHQRLVCQRFPLSKLRQSHVKRKNKPIKT